MSRFQGDNQTGHGIANESSRDERTVSILSRRRLFTARCTVDCPLSAAEGEPGYGAIARVVHCRYCAVATSHSSLYRDLLADCVRRAVWCRLNSSIGLFERRGFIDRETARICERRASHATRRARERAIAGEMSKSEWTSIESTPESDSAEE